MLRSTITLLFAACVTIAGWPVLAFEQLPVERLVLQFIEDAPDVVVGHSVVAG